MRKCNTPWERKIGSSKNNDLRLTHVNGACQNRDGTTTRAFEKFTKRGTVETFAFMYAVALKYFFFYWCNMLEKIQWKIKHFQCIIHLNNDKFRLRRAFNIGDRINGTHETELQWLWIFYFYICSWQSDSRKTDAELEEAKNERFSHNCGIFSREIIAIWC